jgi:hypothetical protein
MFSNSKSGIPLHKMSQYLTSNICVTISASSTMLRFSMCHLLQKLLHFIEKKRIPLGVCVCPSRNDIWSLTHKSDNTGKKQLTHSSVPQLIFESQTPLLFTILTPSFYTHTRARTQKFKNLNPP